MRTLYRTGDAAILRDVGAIGVAMVAVGASFGAMAIAAGLPAWAALAMSVIVFAGGAQFMALGLVAAGSPLAAVLAGLLLNARHLPFGLALGDTLGSRRWQRLLGSHLMTDESTAFALARPAGPARQRAFWLAAVLFFLTWNAGTALGVLAGGAAGDPAALGLDAAFPAGLAALLVPSLRDRDTRWVALTGAGLAVLATPLLPAGLPVLLALTALLVPVLRGRRRANPGPAPAGAAPEGGPAHPAAGPRRLGAMPADGPRRGQQAAPDRPHGRQQATASARPDGDRPAGGRRAAASAPPDGDRPAGSAGMAGVGRTGESSC